MNNEKKFYESLERIFVGTLIEGEGGYVNLLKIKQKYYSKVVSELKNQIDNDAIITESFKNEFYEKLYNFFEKYFSECGSVYFTKTASWQRIYEKVYNGNKDVALFWKTHMLYYVKSDILFRGIYVKSFNAEEDINYVFYFDVSSLQQKQNNEKAELVFNYKETKIGKVKDVHDDTTGDKTFVLSVTYSERGKKTDLTSIVSSTGIKLDVIEKAINSFKKQTTVDFFINKNAKEFLEEQLELFLHQYLLEDTMFNQERLNQIKTIQTYAKKLINFISQFENELVFIWNKPKFVKNSNYVISIDMLNEDIIEKIRNHKNLSQQIDEWVKLFLVDEGFTFNELELVKHPHLPLDTKYFKDIELDILKLFDNLDEVLDGRIIHSDNYQALNTIKKRYTKKIATVYIDPPFNTGKDFAYIDGYQNSTWLSLMKNRFDLIKEMMNNKGSFFLHLDERADFYGRMLLDNFEFDDIKQITFHTMAATDDNASTFGMKNVSSQNFVQESQTIYYGRYKDCIFHKMWKPNRRTSKLGINSLDLIAILKNGGSIKAKKGYDFFVEKYDKNGELSLFKIDKAQAETIYTMGDIWNDILSMSQSTVRQHGENISFQGQKPESLLRRIIQTASNKKDIILDYFAGTATTAAVAHKLNRKWITIELGEHFDNFYKDVSQNKEEIKLGCLGRLKQTLNGDKYFKVPNSKYKRSSTLSKDINYQGGGFFKYYELEQYEDVLNKAKYSENIDAIYSKDVFSQYVFFADDKFANVLNVKDNGDFDLNFDKLYENIDFPETISLLYGKAIEKITEDYVKLADINEPIKYNVSKMTNEEKLAFVKILKPLIWWGK